MPTTPSILTSSTMTSATDANALNAEGTGRDDTITGMANNFMGRRVLGVPYQYRPSVDTRVAGTDSVLGVEYMTMIAEAPYISIMPGKPLFLPDLSEDQKKEYEKLSDKAFLKLKVEAKQN